MLVVGIDPGKTGGIALLHSNGSVSLFDIPYTDGRLDVQEMHRMADLWQNFVAPRVVIEQVGGALRDGASNAFTFGWNTGAMTAAIMLAGHMPEYVTPARWKMRTGLKGKGKRESLKLARKLYPNVLGLELVKHEGLAEALLIAHYSMHGGLGRV